VLLKTLAAVTVPTAGSTRTVNATTTATSPPLADFTGAGNGVFPGAGLALSVAVGIAAYVL
jgi:hypothetical protein